MRKFFNKTLAGLCACTLLATTTLFAQPSTAYAKSGIDCSGTNVITQIPGTTTINKSYDESFLSVTGFAGVNDAIKDRSEYVGTEYYRTVATGKEFLQAIADAKEGKVKVIEITDNIDLGYNNLALTSAEKSKFSFLAQYGNPKANASMTSMTEYKGFTNPEMLESGVSKLTISGIDGLTIFSKNGCSISHVETKINNSANDIVIRNLHFKDMWQWDDDGKQKAVGWSNLKLNGGTNLWIDHCTFDVAFDGNIDIENGSTGITISWCKIGQAADETFASDSAIYRSIMFMEDLYKAGKLTSGVYRQFRNAGATPEQIMAYSAYHKKCHLAGSGDKDYVDYVDGNGNVTKDGNDNIKLTMAYNEYINVGQRVPMIRQGVGHLFNCIIDDSTHQEVLKLNAFKSSASDYKLSRCLNARNGACIAADTCIFNGIYEPITGAELQGSDLGNMSAPWTVYFKNAYNRSLIVNSRVINDNADYTGCSWDNNGSNPLSAKFVWVDKSTLGNWAWSSSIVGKEDMNKSNPPVNGNGAAEPFEFTYGTDEELPYTYSVMPLNEFEATVKEKSGCGVLAMTEAEWTMVKYVASVPVTGIEIEEPETTTITEIGGTITLNAAVTPDNADNKNYTYSSSNEDVATVDENGVVKAIANGTAVITVTSEDGSYTDTITITVAVPNENPGSNPDGNSNGNTSPVPTGDSTNAGMWVVLMISGLLAAIIAGRQEMKKAKANK